jgi:hypothetical protein
VGHKIARQFSSPSPVENCENLSRLPLRILPHFPRIFGLFNAFASPPGLTYTPFADEVPYPDSACGLSPLRTPDRSVRVSSG